MKTQFCNRTEAGQFLAENLSTYANREDVLVLALPRGGVPVAWLRKWRKDFSQTSDEEVRDLLAQAGRRQPVET